MPVLLSPLAVFCPNFVGISKGSSLSGVSSSKLLGGKGLYVWGWPSGNGAISTFRLLLPPTPGTTYAPAPPLGTECRGGSACGRWAAAGEGLPAVLDPSGVLAEAQNRLPQPGKGCYYLPPSATSDSRHNLRPGTTVRHGVPGRVRLRPLGRRRGGSGRYSWGFSGGGVGGGVCAGP